MPGIFTDGTIISSVSWIAFLNFGEEAETKQGANWFSADFPFSPIGKLENILLFFQKYFFERRKQAIVSKFNSGT